MNDSNQEGALHLTDDNFKETIEKSDIPVFVDFYADWCGPCQMAAPIVDKLATEYQGKVLIVKLNVDQNPKTAQEYRVMSIPTVIVFKKDEAGEMKVSYNKPGFAGEAGFRTVLEEALK